MLGFKDMVEAAPRGFENEYRTDPAARLSITPPATLFGHFHSVLKSAPEHPRITNHLSHMLEFSDCAFVVCESALSLAQHARFLQHDLITYDVAVRMGMARGTFYPGTFSASAGRQVINRALFYGTGVVRATIAEKLGGKGCRVFIHSSLTEDDLASIQTQISILEAPGNHPDVPFELNYLLGPRDGHELAYVNSYIHTSLDVMRGTLIEPVRASVWLQYTETLDALNRMAAQHNYAPFSWRDPLPTVIAD
jgi:hypothetical protein